MSEFPAFPRSSSSHPTTTISAGPASSYDSNVRVHHPERNARRLSELESVDTSTSTVSRQAHKLLGIFGGERRSRLQREQRDSLSHGNKTNRVSVIEISTSLRSSAEGGRTKTKSSKSFKSLFSSHSTNKIPSPSRKARRASANPCPRMGLFIKSRKAPTVLPHPPPMPDTTRPLIQARYPSRFVPSLPAEVWLLILKYAAYPPFIDLPTPTPKPVSPLNPSYTRSYPYPTTYDPHSEAISFMHHPTAHTHLQERLSAYRAHMRSKAALRRVCRAWAVIAHEVMYEFVWIASAKEGRELAGMLCGDIGEVFVGATVSVGGKEVGKGKEREEKAEGEGRGSFGRKWIGKHKEAPEADARSVISRKSSSLALPPPSVGRWIKRLHVETRALERCSPHDLLLILQHCPNLEEYSDYKSVRRPMHPLMLSLSDVAPFSISTEKDESALVAARQRQQQQQALLTPDALLYNLLSRPLRRLTWTNYDYDATDFEAGLRFYEDVVAPRLEVMGGHLEYLELVLSGTATHGMGQRSSNGWGVGGACGDSSRDLFGGGREVMGPSPTLAKNPAQTMYGAANMLTQLEASYTSTSVTSYPPSISSISLVPADGGDLMPSIDGYTYALRLPALQSLKVTLDNATFHVLSTWDMPRLTHLSIVAADFGYNLPGFRRFFEVHGEKIWQLELGHSSGAIEEAWITEPATGTAAMNGGENITLEAWCPRLVEFICSADAEWNWQRPDWIAPHVLLPSHAGVKFIGVRDMEKRLLSDLDEALRRRRSDGSRQREGANTNFEEVEGWDNWSDEEEEVMVEEGDEEEEETVEGKRREDDPYFALLQQFGSLLRRDAFPSLLYVRDMSWESDIMRRTCTMRPLPSSASIRPSPTPLQEPQPLHTARHNSYASYSSPFLASSSSQSQHWWSGTMWNGVQATTAAAPKKGSLSRAEQAQIAAREAEGALARAYGRRINVFWRRVTRMCRRRSVWLEDCFGVNVTKANLKQAGAQ